MSKNAFRNKKDLVSMRSVQSPREAKSQKSQYESGGNPNFRKDKKTPMKKKLK